jgi:hypothetical protein
MPDYSYLEYEGAAADSKQLRILKKLSLHLGKTPGYEDIKVFRGKSVLTAATVEDSLSILEAPRSLFGEGAGDGGFMRSEQWALLLQGWPKDDPENPSDPAYPLKAAVEQQLSEITRSDDPHGRKRSDPLYLLGGDIGGMEIGQGIVRPVNPESGTSRLAEFFLPLLLEVQTDKRDPTK